jgi:hypothetical protein
MHASDSQTDLAPSRNGGGGGGGLGTLGTASRVGGPPRYTMDVIYKIDATIEKCKRKMQKMDAEYKKLYQILLNSEQRKREKDLKAQI